ncbi:hypothetical protein SprV_0100082800 [Sparganum proliferum]
MPQQLVNLPVAADEDASVESRWCQLRLTVQSTALHELRQACRQHQNWFDNDAVISSLLAEKNWLRNAYVNRPTDANKAGIYFSHRLVPRPCRKPCDSDHPRHRRSHCRCPAAINHRHYPPYVNPCADHSDQLRQHHDFSHPSTDGTTADVPSPSAPPPPVMWTRSQPVLIAITHSPLTSACSVTWKSAAETGEPVPGAAAYTRRIRFNCPHCSRTFGYRVRLLGHKRIHKNCRLYHTVAPLLTSICTTQQHHPSSHNAST